MECMTVPPPQVDNDNIVTGNGLELTIECLGKVNMVFHSTNDILVTLTDVVLARDLSFNLYSLGVEYQPVVTYCTGTYALSGCLFFLCASYGS